MSIGTDPLISTADYCRVYRFSDVSEAEGNTFIGWGADPDGSSTDSDQVSVDDYGWGTTYDNIGVKYQLCVIPLITGTWQWGIPSRDDLGSFRLYAGDPASATLAETAGTDYQNAWMVAGRIYFVEFRWYELLGPGNFDPRFKYPDNETERVIQTTESVLSIYKYGGYVDNVPLLANVL